MKYITVTVDGGLNTVTDKITVPPGTIQDCQNFEVGTVRGLTRIDGFERYDGRISPSSVTNFLVIETDSGDLSGSFDYGEAVTWEGGSGLVIYLLQDANAGIAKLGLTNIIGRNPRLADVITNGVDTLTLGVDSEMYDFTQSDPSVYYSQSAPTADYSLLEIGTFHWPTASIVDAEGTGEWLNLFETGPLAETLNSTVVNVTGRVPEVGDNIYDENEFLVLTVTENFVFELFNSSQQAALNNFIDLSSQQYRDAVDPVTGGGALSRIPGSYFFNDKLYAVSDLLSAAFAAGDDTGLTLLEGTVIYEGTNALGPLISVIVTSGTWEAGTAAGYLIIRPSNNNTVGTGLVLRMTSSVGPQFATSAGESTNNRALIWYTEHNGAGGWTFFDNVPRVLGYKQDAAEPTDPDVFFAPYARPGLTAELTDPTSTALTDPITGSATGWTNSVNAEINDGVYANSPMSTAVGGGISQELKVLFNFENEVPAAATILGIEVTMKRYMTESVPGPSAQVVDHEVILTGIAGAVQNKAYANLPWGEGVGAVTTETYGGPTDTWGGAVTVSEVRDPATFGVKIRAKVINGVALTNYQALVDVVTCKIYYQPQTTQIYIWNGTSDIEATAIHRVIEAGSASGNTAEGVVFITGVATDSAKTRLIGAGEQIRTGATGTGSLIAITTSSDAPFTLPSSYEVEAAGTRYVNEVAAPYIGTENEVVIFANGVERACLFDGTNLVPLGSGLTRALEKPSHVAFTGAQAALGYPNSSVEISEIGNVALYGTAVNGSVSLQFQGSVTGLQRTVGDALVVWTTNNIQTFDLVNAAQRTISAQSGAIPYTVCDMGQPMFADFRGINSISAILGYGDFQRGKFSEFINQLMIDRLQSDQQVQTNDRRALCAFPVRNKNQYRLIFRDGIQITGTFLGEGLPQFTWQRFYVDDADDSTKNILFLSTCYGTTSGGKDLQFFSISNQPDYNRYMFRMDSGRTFDGVAIKAYFTLNPLIVGGPSALNRWQSVYAIGSGYGYATLDTHIERNFKIPTETSPGSTNQPFGMSDAPSTSIPVPIRNSMTLSAAGSAMDCTVRIQSESQTEGPYTIQAFQFAYEDQEPAPRK